MAEAAEYRPIAIATLVGSLMSCFATSCVLLSFAIYRHQMSSFRHALVLNLSLAEFVNSLNNSVSGIIFVRQGRLQPGTACTVNGFVGQLSVQAGDFSILAIAVVTLLTVTRTAYMPNASKFRKTAICFAVWVVPIVTSITATALGAMTTVGGNWCWISSERTDLRYALTHGWRFAVIFGTIGIYIFIWAYLRDQFKLMHASQRWSYHSTSSDVSSIQDNAPRKEERVAHSMSGGASIEMGPTRGPNGEAFGSLASSRETVARQPALSAECRSQELDVNDMDDDATLDEMMNDKPSRALQHKRSLIEDMERITPTVPYQAHLGVPDSTPRDVTATNGSEFPMRRESHQAEREIKRMMLLNAYPIAYILLWLPGITNRLLEATGHSASAKVAASLQVSTQFVGFANALTYGFNHHLRDRLKDLYVTKMRGGLRRRRRRF